MPRVRGVREVLLEVPVGNPAEAREQLLEPGGAS